MSETSFVSYRMLAIAATFIAIKVISGTVSTLFLLKNLYVLLCAIDNVFAIFHYDQLSYVDRQTKNPNLPFLISI